MRSSARDENSDGDNEAAMTKTSALPCGLSTFHATPGSPPRVHAHTHFKRIDAAQDVHDIYASSSAERNGNDTVRRKEVVQRAKQRDAHDEPPNATYEVARTFHQELVHAHEAQGQHAQDWHPQLPELEDVVQVLDELQGDSGFSDEYFRIALVYFQRFHQKTGELLSLEDWRSALLVCLMVAVKVYDDEPALNAAFCVLHPHIQVEGINELELSLLIGINWDTTFSNEVYLPRDAVAARCHSDRSRSASCSSADTTSEAGEELLRHA